MRVTEEALYKGIEQARIGNRVSDIASAVQTHAEAAGFSVVRQYVGHGVGTHLHEAPEVPNYVDSRSKSSPRLHSVNNPEYTGQQRQAAESRQRRLRRVDHGEQRLAHILD